MKYLLAALCMTVSAAAVATPVSDVQSAPALAQEAAQMPAEKADVPPPRRPLINVKFVLVRAPVDKDRPAVSDIHAAPANSRLLDGGHDFEPNTYYYHPGYGWR